jgi:hypothetical protein
MMEAVALSSGRELYDYQTSRAVRESGIRGSRFPYFDKDLKYGVAQDQLPPSPIGMMVDVDYYVDMPRLLSGRDWPVIPWLLYTIVPETVAGTMSASTSFRFNECGELVSCTAGSTTYVHKIWNYSVDRFTVRDRSGAGNVVYEVDTVRVGPGRAVVLLNPIAEMSGVLVSMLTGGLASVALSPMVLGYEDALFRAFWAVSASAWLGLVGGRKYIRYISEKFFGITKLKRLDPVCDGHLALQVLKPEGMQISVARLGQWVSATVPAAAFTEVEERVLGSKSSPNVGAIETVLRSHKVADPSVASSILLGYFLAGAGKPPIVTVPAPVIEAAKVAFTKYDGTTIVDTESKGVPMMAPLATGARVPMCNVQNDRASVAGRVTKVASGVKTFNKYLLKTMREFVQRAIPDPHVGAPCTEQLAVDKWVRPSQRSLLAQWWAWSRPTGSVTKSFQKAEAYGKLTDPRKIENFSGPEKLGLARFTMALAAEMKEKPWYAMSEAPGGQAEKMSAVLTCSQSVVETDYTRFDGSLSYPLRELEKAIGHRFFAPEYHRELDNWLRCTVDRKGVTEFGVKYTTGAGRLSGEPGTSLWNTVINAFVAYLALRTERVNANADQVYGELCRRGLFGGDDGVVGNLGMAAMEKAARMVGLIIKPALKKRGEEVSFLARVYGPGSWFGKPDSCCDVLRQLPKFHLCFSRGEAPRAILAAKAAAFLLDDANTPIIGIICAALCRRLPMSTLEVGPYHVVSGDGTRYPNDAPGGWLSLPDEVTGVHLARVQAWCDDNETPVDEWLEQFPTMDLRVKKARPQDGFLVGDVLVE